MMLPIFEEANDAINGDRARDYGHPLDNHTCTAEFWTTYLKRRGLLAEGKVIEADDICMMLDLQKTSRQANSPKWDNLVDKVGYIGNLAMMAQRRALESTD